MDGIVLGRIAHYFDAGNGSCSSAIVVDVHPDVARVNLTVFNHSGAPIVRTSVPVKPDPDRADVENSAHLAQTCPWKR